MNRIATLNLAEIETVVGGFDPGISFTASLTASRVPQQVPGGEYDLGLNPPRGTMNQQPVPRPRRR